MTLSAERFSYIDIFIDSIFWNKARMSVGAPSQPGRQVYLGCEFRCHNIFCTLISHLQTDFHLEACQNSFHQEPLSVYASFRLQC